MSMRAGCLVAGVLCMGALGCRTPAKAVAARAGAPPLATASEGTEHAAAGTVATNSAAQSSPQLKPGLVLRVAVLVVGKKEIDEPYKRLSSAGDVTLPLIGTVELAGQTLEAATRTLEARYAEYFVTPQVVLEYVMDGGPEGISPWGGVTVLGRVRRPGTVSIPPTQDLTVSRAIQASGGLDASADEGNIRITRQRAGQKALIREVNLKAVGARGQVAQDLKLEAGDILYVPESFF
jgi:protein involved in polysaccharide export with SLBB domain